MLYRCLFIFLLFPQILFAQEVQPEGTLIYQFDIKEEIAPPILRKTQKAFREAEEMGADIVFINMNTYGGMVDAADSIRTMVLNSAIPVFVLIENNAASAGALISIACDSIFMQPGSTIGAATVVDQTGAPLPDKYQSYMRKKMRATAEETGRDADIAEAMVDPDKVVEGVSEKGKVVTFTVDEAKKYGFCDGEFRNMQEVLAYCGIETYTVERQHLTAIDHIIGWLVHPAISGILILVIIGGIYFELQTPGIGFPLIAAVTAAVLYFAPLYLEGLAAHWEILLFIVGLVLIAVELFVIPGFGVAGISGITLLIGGLVLSLIGNVGFDFTWVDPDDIVRSFFVVIIASTVSIAGSIFLAVRLLKSNAFSRVVLQSAMSVEEGYVSSDNSGHQLVGKEGTAHTVLRPGGKVEVEGKLFDAASESGYIEQGSRVVVIRYSTAQLIVREI